MSKKLNNLNEQRHPKICKEDEDCKRKVERKNRKQKTEKYRNFLKEGA